MAWSTMLQYRAEMVIWALWGLIHPLLALAVWSAAAGPRTIAGFDRADFSAYFLLLMIFSHLTMSWDAFEFSWLVQSGRLSAKLLRPMHPVHEAVAYNIAFKAMVLVILVPIWLVCLWTLGPRIRPEWWHIAAVVPTLVLGAMVRFIWNYCMAIIAFWVTKTDAVVQLYWSAEQFLGARIAPLAVMPALLQSAAAFAPFRCMTVFPVEVAMGRVEPDALAAGIAEQCFWLAAGYAVFRLLWRRGVKHYSAVGA